MHSSVHHVEPTLILYTEAFPVELDENGADHKGIGSEMVVISFPYLFLKSDIKYQILSKSDIKYRILSKFFLEKIYIVSSLSSLGFLSSLKDREKEQE